MMELGTIHHIALNVSDYERSKAFYINQLGFRILGEYVFPSGTRRMDCISGSCRLEIFSGCIPGNGYTERNLGYRHLCFYTSDIETVVSELKQEGIEVEEIRTDVMAGGKMTFFRDPDGIVIELHE